MSSVPLPDPRRVPETPAPRPRIVERPPKPPRRVGAWITAGALGGIALALFLGRDLLTTGSGGSAGGPIVATAVVETGDLTRTVRLSGTIQAERFAALMVPQLRGSRSGRGMGGLSSRSSGGGSTTVSSGSSSSTSSSSSSSTTAASSSLASSGQTGSDTSQSSSGQSGAANSALNASIGTGATSLGAIRGSTNRFSDRSTSSTSASKTGSSSSASRSGSTGGSSLGSTGGSLFSVSGGGGGGGGGRGGDFMLVLLSLVTPGASVRKGDVVAEFDRQYMINRVDDYRASVIQAEADVRKMKADQAVARETLAQRIRVAKADLEKARLDLRTLEVVSDMDATRLKLAAEEAEARHNQLLQELKLNESSQAADLRGAEIELAQTKIELRRAEANADRLVMRAPMDGIAVMQSVRRGMEQGQVQVGDQLYPGQMFLQIVDPSSMVVNATVNQVDSEILRIGQKAKVQLDAFPGVELQASVHSIGAVPVAGRRANFMKTIPIRLKLATQDKRVIPDLSASADILVSHQSESTLIPLSSVFRDNPKGKPFVYLRGPGDWTRREVELGESNSFRVSVKSGLQAGDVVSLAPPAKSEAKPTS